MIAFTGLDMVPLEGLNRDNFLDWLSKSGWVEALVRKNLNKRLPYTFEEVCSELYLMIYGKVDRIIEIYQKEYLGAAVVYMQRLIGIQIKVPTSTLYKLLGDDSRTVNYDLQAFESLKINSDNNEYE